MHLTFDNGLYPGSSLFWLVFSQKLSGGGGAYQGFLYRQNGITGCNQYDIDVFHKAAQVHSQHHISAMRFPHNGFPHSSPAPVSCSGPLSHIDYQRLSQFLKLGNWILLHKHIIIIIWILTFIKKKPLFSFVAAICLYNGINKDTSTVKWARVFF